MNVKYIVFLQWKVLDVLCSCDSLKIRLFLSYASYKQKTNT